MIPKRIYMKNIIEDFQKEVLDLGPEASLPMNLNNKWLDFLSNCLELCLDSSEEPNNNFDDKHMSIALMAIIHILMAKNSTASLEIPEEEFFQYFKDYQMELGFESVTRKTDMSFTPATLESIFTNRSVEMSMKTQTP